MGGYTHVIWDWNGTLLNDVEWCVSSINAMLKKRGLPVINSVEAYHRIFGFPVIDYYRRAGFDFEKESFENLAVEYINLYHGLDSTAALYPDAERVLSEFQNAGVRQIILSASELTNLMSQIKPFHIEPYFDEILGVSDIYASGKIDLGMSFINRTKPRKAILIGDTTHDKEVADALGIDCVLIANGHQSKAALLSCGTPVVDRITDMLMFI